MKTCPRCGARAFEDASVCYGCLYQFTIQDIPSGSDPLSKPHQEEQEMLHENHQPTLGANTTETRIPVVSFQAQANQDPPEFCIHLIPRHSEYGGWKWDCSVEIAEKVKHEVVGRHALQVH